MTRTRHRIAVVTSATLLLLGCDTATSPDQRVGSPDGTADVDQRTSTEPVGSRAKTGLRGTTAGSDPVAATASAQDEALQTTSAASSRPRADITWVSEVEPIGGPVLVDDTLVAYTRDGAGLAITGVAPDTGEPVWSFPATPSQALAGVGLRVEPVGEDRVVHLEPVEGREGADSRVVVRAAATGEVVLEERQDGSSHYRLPQECEDREGEVCVWMLTISGHHFYASVLDEDGSTSVLLQDDYARQYTTSIGALGLRRMTGQEIGRVKDGELLWTARTDEVFGGDSSTSTGWTFTSVADDALIVGTVGPVDDPREIEDLDLRDYAVAALDAETGERIWRAEATSLFCDADLGLADDPLLACRFGVGTLRVEGDRTSNEGVDLSLVRLDPRTGETLWEVHLTPDGPQDFDDLPAPFPLDEGHVTLMGLVVDVEDGTVRPLADDETAWAADHGTQQLTVPALGEISVYPSGDWELPPRISLTDPASTPGWPLPPRVGTSVEDGRVITVDGQLVRFGAPLG